jgi:hypothetical protein
MSGEAVIFLKILEFLSSQIFQRMNLGRDIQTTLDLRVGLERERTEGGPGF